MTQYLDRAFVTDWGIKEVTVRETFPIMPSPEDDRYFVFESKLVKAVWPEHEAVKKFLADFPNVGVAARKLPAHAQEALDEWAERNNLSYENLTVDFVLRSRHEILLCSGLSSGLSSLT